MPESTKPQVPAPSAPLRFIDAAAKHCAPLRFIEARASWCPAAPLRYADPLRDGRAASAREVGA